MHFKKQNRFCLIIEKKHTVIHNTASHSVAHTKTLLYEIT